jgi:hypothetical protein
MTRKPQIARQVCRLLSSRSATGISMRCNVLAPSCAAHARPPVPTELPLFAGRVRPPRSVRCPPLLCVRTLELLLSLLQEVRRANHLDPRHVSNQRILYEHYPLGKTSLSSSVLLPYRSCRPSLRSALPRTHAEIDG